MAGLCRSQLRLMQDKSSWNYKFFLSVYKWFHCFCYVYIYFEIIQTEKKNAKQYTENLIAMLQYSNKNSHFSSVSLILLITTQSRSSAFRLPWTYVIIIFSVVGGTGLRALNPICTCQDFTPLKTSFLRRLLV